MNPRPAAHRILKEVRAGTFSDLAAAKILPSVRPEDRGLALELAYGCLRLRARLDTWIQAHTDRPVKRIDAAILDWLRIGTYQLKELRTPDHAAVSETVRWARGDMDRGRAGYVNAVLRAVAADLEGDPFKHRDTDLLRHLTTWGSHPEWLLRRWLDRWTQHDVTRLVEHDNRAPNVVLRMLTDEPPHPPEGVELAPNREWPRSYTLKQGAPGVALAGLRAVIQDPGASAVVDYVGAQPPGPVVDVCSAPGTKGVGLAATYGVSVLATDVSAARLARVREPVRRLGLPIVAAVADARSLPVAEAGTVLADAPCTGTGVLRRRADARWRIDEARLDEMVRVQRDILDECARVVRVGGLIVYSTCSLEAEENEAQVDEFLDRHTGFEREPLDGASVPASTLTERGDLFVRPWVTGTDGAFAARLRRTS